MNIGIDFDGVLFDSERILRSTAAIFNSNINGNDVVYPEELRSNVRYQWSKEIEHKFLSENLFEIFKKAPVMIHAKYVIEELKNAGHKLFAITHRGSNFKEEIEITNKRLQEENIVFDKVFYGVSNKLELCQKLNIDIMIDDLYDTIEKISNAGIKCFYYRDLVLKFCNNPYVTEVRTWGDIYVECKKLGLIK